MSFEPVRPYPKKSCPACLEPLDENVWAHGKHRYHGHCIIPWVRDHHPSCPSCRALVDTTSLLGYKVIIEKKDNSDDVDIFSYIPKSFNYVIAASVLIPTYTLLAHGDPSILVVTAAIGMGLLSKVIVK